MLTRPNVPVLILLAALAALALVLPLVGGAYAVKFVTRVLVVAIFVVSLDFLIGITGLVSFGHAMFFGLGAYTIYFVSPESEAANALIAFPAAMLVAGAAAIVVGGLAVLTRGFYFIMVTLAFGQMFFSLFHDTRIAGGSDGAYINVKPEIALAGVTLVDFDRRTIFYYFCLALLVASYVFLLWLARTPFGQVLQALRFNEQRVRALGFDTYAHKLVSFAVAGAIAGLAGALFATIDGYVAPELLGWRQSGTAIMMVVLGGVGTLFGPIIGAVLYAIMEEVLKTASIVGPIAEHWSLGLGIILIGIVLSAPRGLAGMLDWQRPIAEAPTAATPVARARTVSAAKELEVGNLTRSFGGLVAVDHVTLSLPRNQVHGIIGPNGAGKTTFINLLSGELRATAGCIRLDGEDIAGRPPHAIARRGLGRTYQRTNVVLPFTARENCLIAAHARHPSPWRLSAHRYAGEESAAVAYALDATGLSARADVRAAHLSHGEQRQLEIAMLIASGAKLLLLDEPLAGMGPEETGRVTSLLRSLATDHTVVLIEHDIDAIFAVADTLTVLVSGKLLAHGAPADIRRDPAVRQAYLGRYGEVA